MATITIITLGILGGMGVLSAQQIGWGIIGATSAALIVNFGVYRVTDEGKRVYDGFCEDVHAAAAETG